MELNDLKNDWDKINPLSGKINKLTAGTIETITRKKYRSKLNKIAYPELAGALVCLTGAVTVCFYFGRLTTTFLQITAIATTALLIVMPALSLASLRCFNPGRDWGRSYADTLQTFALQQIRFIKVQKINVLLSHVLLVTTLILLPQFVKRMDVAASKYYWTLAFPLLFIFLLFFSRWVIKRYNKAISQAGEVLNDLEI